MSKNQHTVFLWGLQEGVDHELERDMPPHMGGTKESFSCTTRERVMWR